MTVLDPSYEALFEDGAVYTEAGGMLEVIDRFLASPQAFAQQSEAGRKLVEAKFSLATYETRMAELYAALELPPMPALKAARHRRRPDRNIEAAVGADAGQDSEKARRIAARRRLLFVATNGIGLGHITRLMAIAERMSSDVEPIFVTRSAGSAPDQPARTRHRLYSLAGQDRRDRQQLEPGLFPGTARSDRILRRRRRSSSTAPIRFPVSSMSRR